MRLHPDAREWYQLQIDTLPAITGWEASFDGGTTWAAGAAGTAGDGTEVTRWLVAGPDADPGSATVLTASTTAPLIRAAANPEIVVRGAPLIYLARR